MNAGSGSSARLRPAARLLRHADFDRVYKEGKRHFATHMTVFYLPRLKGGVPRIGITVSRALGGAVDRNRMRRRLREAIRFNCSSFLSSVDVVINPKKSLLKAEFSELQQQVRRAFEVIDRFQGSGPASSSPSKSLNS